MFPYPETKSYRGKGFKAENVTFVAFFLFQDNETKLGETKETHFIL